MRSVPLANHPEPAMDCGRQSEAASTGPNEFAEWKKTAATECEPCRNDFGIGTQVDTKRATMAKMRSSPTLVL
jgi:hypothetical protein